MDSNGKVNVYSILALSGILILVILLVASMLNTTRIDGKITFRSDRDGNAEIYVLNSNGAISRLTNDPANDYAPAWSPDGRKIAFVTGRYFTDENDNLFMVAVTDVASGTTFKLFDDLGQMQSDPDWSPDGKKILYQHTADMPISDNCGIFVMNADGSGLPSQIKNTTLIGQPVSSPDGNRIAFVSYRTNQNNDICVMAKDGSGETRLTDNPGLDEHPAWSPDGSKIAFQSDRDGNYEIYVMNADGSGVTRLTNNPASDAEPAWSPDGSKIAFQSDRDGNYEIYLMNADGSGVTRLTNNPAFDGEPDWGVSDKS